MFLAEDVLLLQKEVMQKPETRTAMGGYVLFS